MGEYSNWNDQLEVYEYSKFVRISDVVAFVNLARRTPFTVRDSFESIRIEFAYLKSVLIVGRTRRFPDAGRFANVTFGAVADLLDRINVCLDLAVHAQDSGQEGVAESHLAYFKEAREQFSHCLTHLMELICGPTESLSDSGIYNRTSFEAKFNVNWITSK